MKVYFLIYSSIASRTLDGTEIADLVAQGISMNNARGITGVLLLLDGVYVHFIEGEKQDIQQHYASVCLDEKYQHVVTLQEGYIEKRHFEGWNIGCNNVRLPFNGTAAAVDLEHPESKKLLSIIDGF